MKPRGWHRITVEWSDGMFVTNHALEHVPDPGHPEDVAELSIHARIGITLKCALSSAGLDDLDVLAQAMDQVDSEDADERKVISAVSRHVQSRGAR